MLISRSRRRPACVSNVEAVPARNNVLRGKQRPVGMFVPRPRLSAAESTQATRADAGTEQNF
jgi:hypothetical protein